MNKWDFVRFQFKKDFECIDDLVQDCSNSIANAMELLQSCTKLSVLSMLFPAQGSSRRLTTPSTYWDYQAAW